MTFFYSTNIKSTTSPSKIILYSLLSLVGVSTLTANPKNTPPKPNVLLICVDDLRPELACYGVDYIHSPNIDTLAKKGRIFNRHYVNSPTCGASRYTLLTGQFRQSGNDALFKRAKEFQQISDQSSIPDLSLPAHFRSHGYTTVSVGKVSHHPGGLGGKDWDNKEELEMPKSWDRHLLPAGKWLHPRGWMHGLANGEIRTEPKDMDVIQAIEGDDSIYPDGDNTSLAITQLQELSKDQCHPFFLAVGILRPHLPFGAPKKYLELYKDTVLPPIPHPTKPKGPSTWHGSGEFFRYNTWKKDPRKDEAFATEVRKHYAACVSYADAQVGKIIEALEKSPAKDNTIIILWGDHGWNLGEHAIWGKHNLFEEALRSPLIISAPAISQAGASSNQVVQTVDVFPTLCELSGLPTPSYVKGRSLAPYLKEAEYNDKHPAVAYRNGRTSIRTDKYRLILHGNKFTELYDHHSAEGETKNIASEHPDLVKKLKQQLSELLK